MKLDRLKMHQEWFDKNQHLIFLEARIVMQELLAMTREARNERDKVNRKDLFITSPCGTYYKWNFVTRNWDTV